MVDYLTLTDASPSELSEITGLATNTLAHHLKVLLAAGLLRRIRSEGDSRRVYLQLLADDPQTQAMLNPTVDYLPGYPKNVLFVCTQNSARSQLAAAVWHRMSGLPPTSAGTRPASRVHPRAVTTGRRHGLHLDHARTTSLTQLTRPDDLLVCVCDSAYEELSSPGGPHSHDPDRETLHWSVPDPVPLNSDAAFDAAYTELTKRIKHLANVLGLTQT
jgi:protein-tyrosine-phosphatase